MMTVENPLADLANKLATVRVVWGIVGTILATLGFSLPFVSPELFTTEAFDQIVSFVVGTVGMAFSLYQAYFRKVVVEPGVKTLEDVKKVKVSYSPFRNVVV